MSTLLCDTDEGFQGRIQDLVKWGPEFFWPIFADSTQWSCVIGRGPGPALGPWKLLGFSLLNMHSLHFGVPFYTIFEIIKY